MFENTTAYYDFLPALVSTFEASVCANTFSYVDQTTSECSSIFLEF